MCIKRGITSISYTYIHKLKIHWHAHMFFIFMDILYTGAFALCGRRNCDSLNKIGIVLVTDWLVLNSKVLYSFDMCIVTEKQLVHLPTTECRTPNTESKLVLKPTQATRLNDTRDVFFAFLLFCYFFFSMILIVSVHTSGHMWRLICTQREIFLLPLNDVC